MSNVINLTAPELVDALSSANDKTLLFQQDGPQQKGGFGAYSKKAGEMLSLTPANNGHGDYIETRDPKAAPNTGGQLLKEQSLILDADIAFQGNKVELAYKTGNAAMTKRAQGSVDIANGIQVLASAEHGLEWMYRNWCQDPHPAYEYRGGGSYPAAHTLVAAAALGTTGTPVTHTLVTVPNTIKYATQPEVTLSNSPAVGSTDLYGKVVITGTDVNDQTIQAELRWTTADITAGRLTKKPTQWFKTYTSIVSSGFSAGSGAISIEDDSTTITYTPQDLILIDFLTLEYAYGGLIPFTYRDLIIEGLTASISRDTAVVWGATVLGGIAGIRENVSGGTDPTPNTGTERASTEVFSGTECYVEIDGVRLYMTDATITGAQGLVNADALNYNLFQTAKPRRDNKRSLNIVANMTATAQNDFSRLYFENATVPDVKFVCRSAAPGTSGKYDSETEIHFFEAEIMEAPSLTSAGNASVPQSISLGAFNNEGQPEFQIKSSQPSYANKLLGYNVA